MDLLPDMQILTHPAMIGIAVGLYCVEFFTDKLPGIDSTWDAIHTFIRIPAGAVMTAMAIGEVGFGASALRHSPLFSAAALPPQPMPSRPAAEWLSIHRQNHFPIGAPPLPRMGWRSAGSHWRCFTPSAFWSCSPDSLHSPYGCCQKLFEG
jgi:hypothetical protein